MKKIKKRLKFNKKYIDYVESAYATSKKLNQQNLDLIVAKKSFKNDVSKLRRRLGILVIPMGSDIKGLDKSSDYPFGFTNPDISRWFSNCPENKKEKVKADIWQLLDKYGLPKQDNYFDWMFNYILYGKVGFTPEVNFNLTGLTISKPLTTGEKRLYRKEFRLAHKTEGIAGEELIFNRLPKAIKKLREKFPNLNDAINFELGQLLSKTNKNRYRRVQGESLELLESPGGGKQEENYYEPTKDKHKVRRFTEAKIRKRIERIRKRLRR